MKHRFEVLDIFRGIFASLVFVFHLRGFANSTIINNLFIDNVDVFVDFFFVLSGFVIAYNNEYISDSDQLKGFYKRRFLRIYPLHLFMLLVFVALETFKHHLGSYIHINQPNNVNNNIYSFFTNLFLLNSVKLFGISDVTWNIPSWSISAEVIAYIVFGALVLFINKIGLARQKIFFYLGLIICSGAAIYILTGDVQFVYSYDYGFLRGIIGFFTGAVCFNIFQVSNHWLKSLPSWVFHIIEMALFFLIATTVYMGDVFKHFGYVYEILFFMAILIFSLEKGFISDQLKKSAILKKIGTYSYSIYMTHALILSLFNVLFIRILKFPTSSYSYLVFVNFIIIYIVSSWTYKNIEMRYSSGKLLQSLKLDLKKKGWRYLFIK